MKQYDVVLWGVTGFTGRLCADYLWRQYGVQGSVRWAVAGRDLAKVRATLDALGCPEVQAIQADSMDKASLMAMAAQTRVVCSTVGPYTAYGSLLVEACVEEGAHYCDLTGEVGWMREMIDRHHAAAQAAGLKIVHACGFDSVPSDMGVYFLQKKTLERYGAYAQAVSLRVMAAKGGFSGGTWSSMSAQIGRAATDPAFARLLKHPYALNPDPGHVGPDRPDFRSLQYDTLSRSWIAPFIMAGINTRVVRRSHALAGFPYGEAFTYDEAMSVGRGIKGWLMGAAILLFLGAALAAKPGTWMKKILDRLAPKPGEGPSPSTIERGYFRMALYGRRPDGPPVRAWVSGDRDPGYGSTSKMLVECALCLALDAAISPPTFGVLTPSLAMGDALLERLVRHAGLTFAFDEAV